MAASVVIPMHNAANFIEECLDSLLAQTFEDLEIIVVDDGSTDRSADIVASYEKYNQVRLIRQPASGGPSSPRNRGIAEAAGDIVLLFDADDIAHPMKLELTMKAFENAPADVTAIITDFSIFNEGSSMTDDDGFLSKFGRLSEIIASRQEAGHAILSSGEAYDLLLLGNFVGTSSVAIRKTAIEKVGMFDQKLRYSEDYDLWIRLALAGRYMIVNKVLHFYRNHDTGLSKSSDLFLAPYQIIVLEKQFDNDLTARQVRMVRANIADNYRCMAWELKEDRNFKESCRHYVLALQYNVNLMTLRGLARSVVGVITAR